MPTSKAAEFAKVLMKLLWMNLLASSGGRFLACLARHRCEELSTRTNNMMALRDRRRRALGLPRWV